MSFLVTTLAKDLRRSAKDPAALAIWIGIPLLIGSLMTLATGGSDGPKPKAHVLVADHDDGFLSGLLVGALSQSPDDAPIRAEEVTEDEGRARMFDGEASALLVIPAGFGDALLHEEPTTLALVTNPTQRILPGLVEETLSILSDAVFYLHRLIGEDLRAFADGPPAGASVFANARIAAFSVKVNGLVERLVERLDPPLIELEEVVEEAAEDDDDASPGFAFLVLPGLLMMSLLFMAQGLSEDMWRERGENTLRRVLASPTPVAVFLGGKVLAGSALMGVVSAVAILVGALAFGVPLARLPLATLWATMFGSVFYLGMILVQLCASSQRVGSILALFALFPLMMLGGSFFPFEAMPAWMVSIGRWTPNGWAVLELRELIDADVDFGRLARALGGMLVFAALLFGACLGRVRRFAS